MFISQSTLEAWLDSKNAEMQDQRVTLSRLGRAYDLEPAVRILSVVPAEGEAATAEALVGRVLAEDSVLQLGGELMGESMLFGDNAFEVEPGYIGVLEA